MTKKDYIKIAGAIRKAGLGFLSSDYTPMALVFLVAARLADVLEEDNPRFNREKFLQAIYSETTKQGG